MHWANWSSLAGKKSFVPPYHDKTNEPTKEGPLSFVLFESPFASVSTVSRSHPSLVSLEQTLVLFPKVVRLYNTNVAASVKGFHRTVEDCVVCTYTFSHLFKHLAPHGRHPEVNKLHTFKLLTLNSKQYQQQGADPPPFL